MNPNLPPTRRQFGSRFAKGAVMLLAATLLLGWAVQGLWNAVLPAVLPVRALGYWQAVGLLVLCRLLVGGWGGGRFGGRGGFAGGRGGPDFGKWQRLSPEERQQFRQQWMGRRFGEERASE